MNSRGFTLVELMATLVVLGLIFGIVIVGLNMDFENAKGKTEDIFVETIEDAMDVYIDTDGKKLNFSTQVCTLSKTHGLVNVYKADDVTLNTVINSSYKPLTEDDLVNPADEDTECNSSSNIAVSIYRDDDYVYYYKIAKNSFGCLKNTTGYITNLPDGSGC